MLAVGAVLLLLVLPRAGEEQQAGVPGGADGLAQLGPLLAVKQPLRVAFGVDLEDELANDGLLGVDARLAGPGQGVSGFPGGRNGSNMRDLPDSPNHAGHDSRHQLSVWSGKFLVRFQTS